MQSVKNSCRDSGGNKSLQCRSSWKKIDSLPDFSNVLPLIYSGTSMCSFSYYFVKSSNHTIVISFLKRLCFEFLFSNFGLYTQGIEKYPFPVCLDMNKLWHSRCTAFSFNCSRSDVNNDLIISVNNDLIISIASFQQERWHRYRTVLQPLIFQIKSTTQDFSEQFLVTFTKLRLSQISLKCTSGKRYILYVYR